MGAAVTQALREDAAFIDASPLRTAASRRGRANVPRGTRVARADTRAASALERRATSALSTKGRRHEHRS